MLKDITYVITDSHFFQTLNLKLISDLILVTPPLSLSIPAKLRESAPIDVIYALSLLPFLVFLCNGHAHCHGCQNYVENL